MENSGRMDSRIFFETDKLAAQLKLSRQEYDALKAAVREEFPEDEMMYQLHLLRALRSASQKSSHTTD
jgi:hypothetical protein